MKILSKIKNSKLINQPAFDHMHIENPHGANFLALTRLLFGTTEFRARSGTFTTPYLAPVQKGYELFKLRYIDDDLSDLYDARAIEIFNYAKSNQKNICICWSGGIDSTSMLTAFFKNLSKNDLEIINVLCTSSSLLENYSFYENFLSRKVKCNHYNSIILDNEFLNKNVLLHGEPADSLFGTVLLNYKDFVARQEHLEPWKKHYKKMTEGLNEKGGIYSKKTSTFGTWFVKKISDNIEEVGQSDYINTVADWWWWPYFNFRWQIEAEKILFYMRIPSVRFDPISEPNLKIFKDYNFWNTEKFQLWSYSNLKKMNANVTKMQKIEPKKYIFEFTKDKMYFENKKKVGLCNSNRRNYKKNLEIPYFFDEYWQGYRRTPEISQIFKMLLEKYRG